MAINSPLTKRGRPRKNRRVAEFRKIDIRDLFRAHPKLHGLHSVSLAYAGQDIVVQIKYHDCVVPRPQPVFVCFLCERGARVLFGVQSTTRQPLGRMGQSIAETASLVCRRCAKADPDSHNLPGEERSLRRTIRLRARLKGGSRVQKAKGQHCATHAQLCRGLRREAHVREEIRGLRMHGVPRLLAERSANIATGAMSPAELTDQELTRALRAFERARRSTVLQRRR